MILSLLILLPLAAGILCLLWGRRAQKIALLAALLLAGLGAFSLFFYDSGGMQFEQDVAWAEFSGYAISYHVGVDGVSYPLVLLTLVIGLVAILVSAREQKKREGAHYALLLSTIAGVVGVFSSLNLVLFFAFWELVLVSMFLLILSWGYANRRHAAMKFLVYTGVGSALLLLAIVLLGSLGIADVESLANAGAWATPLFIILALGFLIKLPLVPFHTWLPQAHVEAPTAGSILLAGVLLKMGGYGLIRLGLGVLPEPGMAVRLTLFILGTVTVIYGALVCLAQRHLKRLVAYSSINHMGFVAIGIAAGGSLGIAGATYAMVSHGLLAALLFALAGEIHSRTGTFDLDRLRGLGTSMPRIAWLLVAAGLGSMGLPGMSGFVAELLVLLSAFAAFGALALVPVAGIFLSAAYIVRLFAKTIFGDPVLRQNGTGGIAPFALLLGLSILLGVLPALLLGVIG